MSLAKRQRLVALARRYRFVIIEDDPYGFLTYDDEAALPPLRALDSDHVLYVGSFSKIMAPALRLGWTVAPPALINKLTVVKEAGDLETSQLTQRAVSAYLDAGLLPDHLDTLRSTYGARRDVMLSAVAAHFPASARWTTPRCGMFVWVDLADDSDTNALLHTAIAEESVAFVPGSAFAIRPNHARNCLRLTFSTCTPDRIADGIARLGGVLAHQPSAIPVG
jgi:2-aminoadipate transaminase